MRLLKFIPLLFFAACSGHSTPAVPETGTENTELLVLTTDLLSDTAAIRAYEQYHSKESAWPELLEANKRAGIEKVAIYRWGTRLVLMMEVPRGINGKTMDSLYRGDDPKVAEWGNIMSGFQVSPLGEDHPQKWVPMQKIHGYENGQFQ